MRSGNWLKKLTEKESAPKPVDLILKLDTTEPSPLRPKVFTAPEEFLFVFWSPGLLESFSEFIWFFWVASGLKPVMKDVGIFSGLLKESNQFKSE